MIFNPTLPPKDGYTLAQDWYSGAQSYATVTGQTTAMGTYAGTSGTSVTLVFPFEPKKLLIRSRNYGEVFYWESGMRVAYIISMMGSNYAYIGRTTVTVSGQNITLTGFVGFQLFNGSYPSYISPGNMRPMNNASETYDYTVWG